MNKIMSLLCVLFFNLSFAHICETTVLINQETNKKVVLFSDMHGLKRFMKDDSSEIYDGIVSQQSKQLIQFGNDLLSIQEASHIVVATEIDTESFGCLYEQVIGVVRKSKNDEALLALPKLLLHNVLNDGSDLQAKIKPFFAFQTASFSLSNGLHWVAADRFRTSQDAHLAFTFYTNLPDILDGINNQSLGDEYKELTIEFVEQYIQDLHTYFEKLGIEDPYFVPMKKMITEALKTEKIHTTDHFAMLHKHLLDTGKQRERDRFNNNMIRLISLKLDAEMREYVNIFNQKKSLTVMLLIAGAAHNELLKKMLMNQGYLIADHSGESIEEHELLEALQSDDTVRFVKKLEKNLPVIDITKII